jgi:hypothetical protein
LLPVSNSAPQTLSFRPLGSCLATFGFLAHSAASSLCRSIADSFPKRFFLGAWIRLVFQWPCGAHFSSQLSLSDIFQSWKALKACSECPETFRGSNLALYPQHLDQSVLITA